MVVKGRWGLSLVSAKLRARVGGAPVNAVMRWQEGGDLVGKAVGTTENPPTSRRVRWARIDQDLVNKSTKQHQKTMFQNDSQNDSQNGSQHSNTLNSQISVEKDPLDLTTQDFEQVDTIQDWVQKQETKTEPSEKKIYSTKSICTFVVTITVT